MTKKDKNKYYNKAGDYMKKYLFPVFLSLVIGSTMAILLISSYKSISPITVSKNAESVYYLQRGVYSSKNSMLENMQEFENYIYNVEDNKYYTYIGITKNKKNAEKIKGFYKEKGYDIYIKEKITDNQEFLTILGQYDEVLMQTTDEKTIVVICNQILSKYEEMTNNEY